MSRTPPKRPPGLKRPVTAASPVASQRPPGRRPAPSRPAANGGGRRASSGNGGTLIQRWRRFDKRWFAFIPVFFVVLLLAMYASIACTMDEPGDIILGKKGLEILDRDGKVIYTIGDEPGSSRIVPITEISPNLINATVATEDANFWDNPGINIKGLARAGYENVAFWDSGGLGRGSGGSSITQQLAKNLYIPPEERIKRSPLRKLKETMIAFELNRRYDKEQVMEWYLSNIFYGQGAYGIESASYRYLNKPPADLTLAEGALLAGIPRSPNYYDPITNPEAAKERQEEVLSLMVRHGLIDQAAADAAAAEPITIREGRAPNTEQAASDDVAIHFALYVRDLLPNLIGSGDAQKQLRVTTTLDYDLQVKADNIVKTNLDRFEPQYGATNGALVAIDPRTGEILAMVGSHDFSRDDISGQVNNALALNQPGSTMKPVTYLTTLMRGWQPNTPIVDEPIQIDVGDGSKITLNNADQRYRGTIPLKVALGSSLNVPAVKALRFSGLKAVYDMAEKMGITSLKDVDNYGDAFTLGGGDVTLLDMTYVYSVFANQGNQAGMTTVMDPKPERALDPIAILKIETVDGKTLWSAKPKQERVIQANYAYAITSILADDSNRVSGFGANSSLNLGSRPGAVKSGSSDSTRDAWAIGYTPQLVTGIWVGNANNAPMPGGTSTALAAPIWKSFMLSALEGQPAQPFPVPETGIRIENGEVFIDAKATLASPTPQVTATKPSDTPTPRASVSPSATPPTATPTRTRTPQNSTPTTVPATPTKPANTPVPTQPAPTATRPPPTQPPNPTATQQAQPQVTGTP